MFHHKNHLEHLLRPDQYYSENQYRAELRHLFMPAWHPVAASNQLANPGDFITLDLLEHPVLIRNMDGELRAFLNVCPHRHSKLTDKPCGRTERLRCQYHGWEFNKEGRTGKIPDAHAFRPWDRNNSCLRQFRIDNCGKLLFINFADDAPPLHEWVGPLWPIWSESFGPAFKPAAIWEKEFDCNWKIVLENSLESYHIPQIHPKTFKTYPDEDNAWHELHPTYSTFRTIVPKDWTRLFQNWTTRRLGAPVMNEYWHRFRFPHMTESSLDVFRMMQCVFPTGPKTCRYRCLAFTLRGGRVNPLAWGLSKVLRPIAIFTGKKIFAEDGAIYDSVQRGIQASPHRGVIGTREERVYTFQKQVVEACGGARELEQLEPCER